MSPRSASLTRTIAALLLGGATLAFAGAGLAQTQGPHPIRGADGRPLNVIILYADDMGWGDLGVQGHAFLRTPAIDRLAATGMRLTQFYVTAPICSPSRAGLLTGRIQNRFGMKKLINDSPDRTIAFHHVPTDEPMMPRMMREAGYRTAHVGKWHISFPDRKNEPRPEDYGYDHSLLLSGARHGSYFSANWRRNGKPITTEGRWSAEVYVDEVIDFIEKDPSRPFFVSLWSFAPHQEVFCAPKYREMYADRSESEQYFYGTITQMDEQYGRLLRYLDEHGLTDHTIVVFSSDNGAEPHLIPWSDRARGSNGGLRGGKHFIYDGGIRVPGIVRWPGVTEPGRDSREVAWTADLMTTFTTATDSKPDPTRPFDGIDLRPVLRGGTAQRPRPLYWEFEGGVTLRNDVKMEAPGLALRDGRWKFHCNTSFERVELYDLDIDQNEQWNLKDVYPEVASRFLATMRGLYAEVNGPYSKSANFWNADMVTIPKTLGDPALSR